MSDRLDAFQPLLKSTWRRRTFALFLGLLTALALPPIYAVPLLWITLSGFLVLIWTAPSIRSAVFDGWAFGTGFFAAGLFWIGHAFLVDAEQFAHLMPFAVVSISIGMALFPAAAAGLTTYLVRHFDLGIFAGLFVFTGCWTFTEWMRGWMFTGFPWNPMSSVWGVAVEMLQVTALIGSLGLTLLTVLIFAAPAVFLLTRRDARSPFPLIMLISALLPVLWLGGFARLAGSDTATRPDMVVRLVQPAIPQADKWKRDLRQGHVIRQMAMSKRTPGPAGAPTVVIWSETNVPYLIQPDSTLPASLAAAVPENGHLIFGAPRRGADDQTYNSLFVIDDDGRLQGTFDKFHLVPFGEYVPLRGLLPFDKLVAGRGDFSAGPGPSTIKPVGLPPFAAIICYEVIFSGGVIDASDRPEWIINITNDAWFGESVGPHQHLVQARFRAVEEGLPLVRVANTGISAVIDSYGRVRNHLGLGENGLVDAPLPVALSPTPFSSIGPWIGLLMGLAAITVPVIVRRRKSAPVSGKP